jgi:peptide/nickel transport system permease protein
VSLRPYRFLARRLRAVLPVILIVIVLICSIVPDRIAPHDPDRQDLSVRLEPPTREYLLGTDQYGRDVLSRVIHGARISMAVGGASLLVLMTVGIVVGAISGYFGGMADRLLMMFTELMMIVPGLFLLVLAAALFRPGATTAIFAIGLTAWTGTARMVRGQVLSIRNELYIEAARALGATHRRIITRHVLPNVITVILVQASLVLAWTIIMEASLSFLGLGVQPPTASWGNMLTDGQQYIRIAWWMAVFPGVAIFVVVLSFNLIADELRIVLTPGRLR